MPECSVKRALISVSDKAGIVEFAKGLRELGVEIVSTGGTYRTLTGAGVHALHVEDVTDFPEILDGRVKTLHPAIHGGILARRNVPEHRAALAGQKITPIDLVAVNLYPFRETASRPGASWEELIENIDIGGPSMVRSAAKNHADVLVIVRPEDYGDVLRRLKETGDCPKEERVRLALVAFRHTAEYDACIFETLSLRASGIAGIDARADPSIKESIQESVKEKKEEGKSEEGAQNFPSRVTLSLEKMSGLRYGENPGQAAALYRVRENFSSRPAFIDAAQLQGKELSYNNWLDADSAFRMIQELDPSMPAAAIVKHTNPCGAAVASTLETAFERAYSCDPISAYGGIVSVNRPVTAEMAHMLQTFFQEVVIAPGYTKEARDILKLKANLRLLTIPEGADVPDEEALEWRSVQGGFLVQGRDLQKSGLKSWKTVTSKAPPTPALSDMRFAWSVVKHVKSNAIVLAKDGATVGIGAGQPNRVGAAAIALKQAGEKARGAVLASDAFFPFPDAVRLAAEYGVAFIVQPGGSLRDGESIKAADESGIAMVFTGVRHFKH